MDQSAYATNPCVNNTSMLPLGQTNMNESQRMTNYQTSSHLLNTTNYHTSINV